VKRNIRRFFLLLLVALNGALAVVLWRSPDPAYRLQELVALGRYQEHDDLIANAARKYKVDPALVKAVVWRESRFSANKVGSAGERGLMQISEAAARDWAAAHKIEVFVNADLFDAKTNLEAGTWYLGRALEHWKDKDDPVAFALAEFNAGRSRVDKWTASSGGAEEMLDQASVTSARRYVEEVMRRFQMYRKYGW
jgi:soluble lytic murein transglycosylase